MGTLLDTINWPLVLVILGLGILVGLALTLKKRVLGRQDILDIAAGMQGTEQAVEVAATQSRAINFRIPFLSRPQEPESLASKLNQAEVKLRQFLNPDELAAVYTGYKKRFAILGLVVSLPIAAVLLLKGQILGVMVVPILGLAGWTIPMLLTNGRRKAMEREVVDIIPDLLGYLSAFVTPEVELVRPLVMVLDNDEEHADNILYASIRESLRELKVGGGFYESLQTQANILGVEEWKGVVFTLNQVRQVANKDVVDVIREVEADFREERKLKLEIEASKVTTKLSIISSLLLVPAIYTYTMAPAYMKLFSTPGFL